MTDGIVRLTAALADCYRIERELGAGGMATVYLAEDLRHDRKVALKVLRPDLAAVIGAERFLQEIKTTANLQHPHILPLHDSGQVDGTVFYVMPYVQGESLRDRLNRDKQLPIDDAVRIAREVADALGYAHEHGIIHRDIKPENILLQRGHALVADFGIALAASRSGGASRMTETGMSLGTPTYMSPEQAMGERDLTARSDVYALGCVLHEMLTGEPPFDGPTAQAIVAKVLTDEPRPASQLRRSVPPNVEAAILTALEKVPADRFATAAEFARALGSPTFTHATPTRPIAFAGGRRPTLLRDPRSWTAVAASAAALALLATRNPRPSGGETGWATMATLLPAAGETWSPNGTGLALSPDGSKLAILSRAGLTIRSMDSVGSQRLRGTDGARYPFWSPDGRRLGFFADNQLKLLDLGTGTTQTLCPATNSGGGSWSKDGEILYWTVAAGTLHLVSASGGPCTDLGLKDTNGAVGGRPYFLPDGKNFVVTSDKAAWLGRLGDSSVTKLIDNYAAEAVFAPPDYLLTKLGEKAGGDDGLYAQRIDVAGRRMLGLPERVLETVRNPGGHTVASAANNGTLVAAGPGDATQRFLTFLTRATGARDSLLLDLHANMLRFSRDGSRLALSLWGLWLFDMERRVFRRVAAELDTGRVVMNNPVWGPGDTLLAFRRGYRDPGYTRFDTRREQATRWFDEPAVDRGSTPNDWSPDGRHVLLELGTGPGAPNSELWVHDVAAKTTKPWLTERGSVGDGRFSSDGRWVAYVSESDGESQIYLRPFPGPGPAIRVSPDGGRTPRWRGDGKELFYLANGAILAVPIRSDGGIGTPVPALSGEGSRVRGGRGFEPTPDGQRFAFLTQSGQDPGLTLVLNWWKLLRVER